MTATIRIADLENEPAFDAYMEQADADLRGERIAIPHRPFNAFSRLQRDTGTVLPFGDPWHTRVHSWFTEKYRSAMKPTVHRRRVLVMLGGEPKPMHVPLIYGRVPVQLTEILDISDKFLERIPPAEVQEIIALAKSVVPALKSTEALPAELFDDWQTSVDSALNVPAAYAHSKWASAQTVEKVLGKYIRSKGGGQPPRPRGHELSVIAERAEQLGLPCVDRKLLAAVDARPAARYRDPHHPVVAAEAVTANQAALFICAEIAKGWTLASAH
jgi:hypothetical protein